MSVAAPWDAHAEDEDSSTQVYLVFDPETGEFVKSHDPNAALPPQTGLESSQANASRPPGAADGTDAGDDGGSKSLLFAAAAVVAVLGGASAAFLRSRRRNH